MSKTLLIRKTPSRFIQTAATDGKHPASRSYENWEKLAARLSKVGVSPEEIATVKSDFDSGIAIASPACVVLFAFPFFWMINTGRPSLIWLAMSLLQFIIAGLYAVTGGLLSEPFDARLRYSGILFGYQMAGLLAAAAPLICAALVQWASGASWPVAT